MQPRIDLRSDTVTRPTPQMLQAMVSAPLGDDVLSDDPTVKRLEELAASILGKEAALFTPSGTMANSIAIACHTRPGDEVLMDWDSHSMRFEVGGPAALWGVQTRQYRSTLGVPNISEIGSYFQRADLHAPGTSLILVENTHNLAGGAVVPLDVIQTIGAMARNHGARFHVDGARLFNASVATGIAAETIVADADSVSFCLSKGLCCPVGSLLCGTSEMIQRARRYRKMLGGGMRQVGVLAACGIVALETMIDRLADDHKLALRLAHGIKNKSGLTVDTATVQTNMVYFQTEMPGADYVARLAEIGVLCIKMGPHLVRAVMHKDVSLDQVDDAIVRIMSL